MGGGTQWRQPSLKAGSGGGSRIYVEAAFYVVHLLFMWSHVTIGHVLGRVG